MKRSIKRKLIKIIAKYGMANFDYGLYSTRVENYAIATQAKEREAELLDEILDLVYDEEEE